MHIGDTDIFPWYMPHNFHCNPIFLRGSRDPDRGSRPDPSLPTTLEASKTVENGFARPGPPADRPTKRRAADWRLRVEDTSAPLSFDLAGFLTVFNNRLLFLKIFTVAVSFDGSDC